MIENKSKMYILIKDDPKIDLGHILLACAHASLSGYLTFLNYEINNYGIFGRLLLFCRLIKIAVLLFFRKEIDIFLDTITEKWARESFRKVACKVTIAEFEKAKTYGTDMVDYRIMVECGLGGMEVAIAIKPRETNEDISLNRFLKSLKLYK